MAPRMPPVHGCSVLFSAVATILGLVAISTPHWLVVSVPTLTEDVYEVHESLGVIGSYMIRATVNSSGVEHEVTVTNDFWKGDHKCHGDGTACQTIEDLFPPRTCGKLGDDKSDIGVFRYQSACPVAKIVLTCLVFATTLSLHALWMNVRVLQGYVPARTAGAATAAATMFFLFGVVVYGGGVVEVAKDIDFGPHASTDADTSFSIACVAVGLGFFAILIDCLVAVPKKDGPGTYSALHGYHTA